MTSNGVYIHKATPKDYAKFVFDPRNRPLRSLKKLIKSMEDHGFVKSNAIMVKRAKDGTLVIMQGAHRYAAATALGIPFYYIIEEEDPDVIQLEATTRSWSLKDYVMSFMNSGIRDYQDLEYYNRKTKIPLSKCINILGESTSSDLVKAGKFRVSEDKKRRADDIGKIVMAAQKYAGKIGRNSGFVQAIIDFMYVDHFLPRRMIHKIKTFPTKLKLVDGVDEYRRLLEALYNHKCSVHTKVDLAFAAKLAADQRGTRGVR